MAEEKKARQLGRKLAGVGGSVALMGVGAVSYGAVTLAGGVLPFSKAPEGETADARYSRMKKYSYALAVPPLALGAAAHFAKKRYPGVAAATAGAAGLALAEALVLGHSIRANNPSPAAQTNGYDTGALLNPAQMAGVFNRSETGALLSAEDLSVESESAGVGEYYDDAMGF